MDWDLHRTGRVPGTMDWAGQLARQYSGPANPGGPFYPQLPNNHHLQQPQPQPHHHHVQAAVIYQPQYTPEFQVQNQVQPIQQHPQQQHTTDANNIVMEEELDRTTFHALLQGEMTPTMTNQQQQQGEAAVQQQPFTAATTRKSTKQPTARQKRKLPNAATAALEAEQTDTDDHTSPDTTNKKRRSHKGGPSTFGKKENPLLSTYGLIDGRSNAQACFEQKVQLLQEFKQQHGHLSVPQFPTDPKSKYRRLHAFLTNQRKFYRKYIRGEKVPLTKERIQMLDQLGEWIQPIGDERWPEMIQQLGEFHKQYGHCCISAVKEKNSELHKFVVRQRFNYRTWIVLQEKRNSTSHNGTVNPLTDGEGTATEADIEEGNVTEAAPTDVEENEEDPEANEKHTAIATTNNNKKEETAATSEDNDKTNMDSGNKKRRANSKPLKVYPSYAMDQVKKKKNRPQPKGAGRISGYYNQEKHDILTQFDCPYLMSYDERPEYTIRKGRLFSHHWFAGLESLKEYRKAHPEELILPVHKGKVKWTLLEHWVKRQRLVYAKILQDMPDWMENEGPIKRYFTLLQKELNLLLDPHKVKEAEAEVYRQERIAAQKDLEEKKRQETPNYKLELALKEEAAAKEALKAAKQLLKEAQAAVNKAQTNVQSASKQVKQLKAQVESHPVGRYATVKPRGSKPHGRAKILKITERKVGNLPAMQFFDLEFEETGQVELFVDGMFVCLADEIEQDASGKKIRASEPTEPTSTGIATRRKRQCQVEKEVR